MEYGLNAIQTAADQPYDITRKHIYVNRVKIYPSEILNSKKCETKDLLQLVSSTGQY